MATIGFKGSIEAFSKKTGIALDTVLRKTVLQILSGVVEATPVDTGRARANWQVSVGSSNPLVVDTITPDVVGREMAVIATLKAGKPVYIFNNVPYILVLEYGQYPNPPKRGTYLRTGQTKGAFTGPGWFQFSEGGYSSQAPGGMARITVQRVKEGFASVLAGGEA